MPASIELSPRRDGVASSEFPPSTLHQFMSLFPADRLRSNKGELLMFYEEEEEEEVAKARAEEE